MRVKAKFIIILVCFLYPISLFSQENDPFKIQRQNLKEQYPYPELSQEQMYQDFDTFVEIMVNCNPQYFVRKQVTQFDMLAELQKYRFAIDKCNNTLDFISLLKKTINLTLDEHCFIGDNVYMYRSMYYEDVVKQLHISDKDFGYNLQYIDSVFYKNEPQISLIYLDGHYLLKNETVFYYFSDSLLLPAGTELYSFNHLDIQDYQNTIKKRGSRWDFQKNHYYNDVIEIEQKDNEVEILLDNTKHKIVFSHVVEKKREEFVNQFNIKPQILYFSSDSLLYIRLHFMILSPNIYAELKSYKNTPIKSILIDIRGNPGGNDQTWLSLLSLISSNNIKYPFCLLSNNTSMMNSYLKSNHLLYKNSDKNFIEVGGFTSVYRIIEQETSIIKSSKKNIGYSGNIYILVDENIYSSAQSLASLSSKVELIKTIGMPTGKIGGQGIDAAAFILPNSRLIFTLDIALDGSQVKTFEDFYHDSITFPLIPSIEYYQYWYSPSRSEQVTEIELYTKDQLFQKAIEIIKIDNH
ncbi:MAG: S41 family peptidase [Bacteroidales bacterium]|jgi:hypothetical protein|nr:S41 family peptidase [Bacteroidales bacterium]